MSTTGFVLTRPLGASVPGGSTFGSKTFNTSISPGGNVEVDTISLTGVSSAKWLVTVLDTTTNAMQTYEVVGQFRVGMSAPSWSRYGMIGSRIQNTPTVTYDNSTQQMKLQIQNNETFSLTIHVARYDVTV